MSGKVIFVGAGPGDPDLLTRKAWKILSAAEIVLHDALVPAAILELLPDTATICNVGKRCGQKGIAQEEIHALLIAHARAGRNVVRLQGGDPLIFGRAGEEIAALREAGVEFELVPGVTAASAAAAALQIPLTDRRMASKVVFASAHRRNGELADDWKSLVSADTTLAIYMPGGSYREIARRLAEAGLAPGTPCAIVSHASQGSQSVLRLDLGLLTDAPEVPAPALLLVGAVVASSAANAAASTEANESLTVCS